MNSVRYIYNIIYKDNLISSFKISLCCTPAPTVAPSKNSCTLLSFPLHIRLDYIFALPCGGFQVHPYLTDSSNKCDRSCIYRLI